MSDKKDTSKKSKIVMFFQIVIVAAVLITTIYFITDTIKYSENQKNQATNTANTIENTIGEIKSKKSGDIMPEGEI